MIQAGKASVRDQVAYLLRKTRKLSPGPERNGLRNLAGDLLRLHRAGFRANVEFLKRPLQ
jgi:hypothetical protein